jgi:hypothetical protein
MRISCALARAVCTWLLVVLSAWSERLDAVYAHPVVNVDPNGEKSCGGTAKPEWKVSISEHTVPKKNQ